MTQLQAGRILIGDGADLTKDIEIFQTQKVDQVMRNPDGDSVPQFETTLKKPFSVTGSGTYTGKAKRTLHFFPYDREGWWFDRTDIADQLPIHVSVRNVWTTNRSIVLRSGNVHNYMRMVEHIIALKLGMGLDNVMIRMDSGDPPLFNIGSMDIVEGVEKSGILEQTDKPIQWLTVKEPVTVQGKNGSFLTICPTENKSKNLFVDCAVDFPTAIGKQRIQFDLYNESFRCGAQARTNCSYAMVLLTKTIGKLFADTRNLGYTNANILIAGKNKYVNEPSLLHEGKSLEAAWHRAVLDLIAALSLIDRGRLCGSVYSYKAGHALDVEMVTQLYLNDLLEPVR